MPRTKRGPGAVQEEPPSKRGGSVAARRSGDDGDAHWRTDFEPEEYKRPRITEPSSPLEAGNEEVDFEVERPREEGLRFLPSRIRPVTEPVLFLRVSPRATSSLP